MVWVNLNFVDLTESSCSSQVALSFGATDLAGPIASRRGLPMIEEDSKKVVKRRELAGYVERAGFRPVFVTSEAHSDAHPAATEAPERPHVERPGHSHR